MLILWHVLWFFEIKRHYHSEIADYPVAILRMTEFYYALFDKDIDGKNFEVIQKVKRWLWKGDCFKQ